MTPFVNDVSKLEPGQARAVVRHTASAPAVDVRAGGDAVFTDLSNPDEASANIDAGTIEADVVLTGSDDVVIGPADLELAEGTATLVYAWGSAEDDNLKLAVQTINNLHSNPSGVPGGTGGQTASLDSSPWSIGLFTVALAGVALSGVQLVRSRVATHK